MVSRSRRGRVLLLTLASAAAWATAPSAQAPRRSPGQEPVPSFEDKIANLRKIDGYIPLYWDAQAGRLWMQVPTLDTELLYSTTLGAGLGSNDIGLDRGMILGSRVIEFERVGPKVLMVQPNYRYRATSDNPAEVRAVKDAFARAVLWGFTIGAESGDRLLIDATDFFVRDTNELAQRLRPGSYRFDATRSTIYTDGLMGFPKNTEAEAELTFVRQSGGPTGGPAGVGGGRGRGGAAFEGVGDVGATAEAATLRVHHSFMALPDSNYEPRRYDPRSGFGAMSYEDRAVPLGTDLTQRFIRRHRLQKKDPSATISDPVEPIVYYLDPGVPEPIRSALLDGARWWNQAFEAAGYRNAFRVEMLPDGANPLDIRYNVINWVHRSTRGWSTGASVSDPRTGEIIRGVVELDSMRIRQDYLIAEGLLSPYKIGTETPPELREWALARIRQLAAHETGHTLGLGHNYYDSDRGRISVMDYPQPLVTLNADGTLDYSKVYDTAIGAWDKVAITYGYQDFPDGTDEPTALTKILDDAWSRDLRYMTNQDMDANPRVDQWANSTDPAAELRRMLAIRRASLNRFGETAIQQGEPMARLEDVFVPLYLYHRYSIDAAASAIGGLHYIYALRGDGRDPVTPVPANEQKAALDALLMTLRPSELTVPKNVLDALPPRPAGYRGTRELFPRYTGSMFDAISPAVVAADLTVSQLLDPARAARLVEQHALDPSIAGLQDVVQRLVDVTFQPETANPYEAEVGRAVQAVVVDELVSLAANAPMPQVRAIAEQALRRMHDTLTAAASSGTGAPAAFAALVASDIKRFMDRPSAPAPRLVVPDAPPGAPIGEPGMDWIKKR